jgi:radical SAM superfamily enzyme YgiQ (UPF0313 family)
MGFKCDWFPLGLGYIASTLRQEGFSAQVYNAEFHTQPEYLPYTDLLKRSEDYCAALEDREHPVWQEISSLIHSLNPDVLGITVKTVKLKAAGIIAEISKSIRKDIIVVAGGPHCTCLPEEVMQDKNIDYIIRGEGELTMLELLEALKGTRRIEKVEGLSYRENSKVIHNKARPLMPELDQIPFPARYCKDFLIQREAYDIEAFGNIITSRGCPFNCAYCSAHLTWTKNVRYRSIADILEEIKFILKNYGTRQITLWDDSFTLNKNRLIQFCQALEDEKLKINWSCTTRFDLLDEEIIRHMKEAGCNNVELGIESGSPRMLKLIKKNISIEKMQNIARILSRYNLYWSGFFMLGLPTETPEDIKMSIGLMKRLKPNYATFSMFTPYPGTELYETLLKNGAVTKSLNWQRYSHQSRNNNFTGVISNEEFRKIVDTASKAFDSNNNRITNILKKALSRTRIYFSQPLEFFKDVRRYLNYIGIFKKGV